MMRVYTVSSLFNSPMTTALSFMAIGWGGVGVITHSLTDTPSPVPLWASFTALFLGVGAAVGRIVSYISEENRKERNKIWDEMDSRLNGLETHLDREIEKVERTLSREIVEVERTLSESIGDVESRITRTQEATDRNNDDRHEALWRETNEIHRKIGDLEMSCKNTNCRTK
jgi:hypothetical protein